MTGCDAVALGAISSNVRFYSAYPMSPATPVMEYLASRQERLGLIVEQAEDEICAINLALGASFSGARAMTGTSGGGISLMAESISLSGMTETQIVIFDGQRPAPATGFPTRTEQGDLFLAVHAGHGDFPRAVLAPSNAREAFHLTRRAFYLAEKYQIPVFLLGDQYLNDSSWTFEKDEINSIPQNDNSILSAEELAKIPPFSYRRYELTDSGVSPRILPGTPRQVVYADSDEHTVEGHITESAEVRDSMVQKRKNKLSALREEMSLPVIYPETGADIYLISWGSTGGVVSEAAHALRENGIKAGQIHFTDVFPLRENIIPTHIEKNSRLISVENNTTGQFADLLRMETGVYIKDRILKYDGRPFTPAEIVDKIEHL